MSNPAKLQRGGARSPSSAKATEGRPNALERSDGSAHAWIASLLQMSDTFYPTGSYAHSFGLEGLVQDGFITDRATLRTFLLEQALPALARTDLIVAAAAWGAAGEPADFGLLEELCRMGSAMRGAREPREAADAIGRQRLELLASRSGGSPLALELKRRSIVGHETLPGSATLKPFGLGAEGGARSPQRAGSRLVHETLPRSATGEPFGVPACVVAAIEARVIGAPIEAALSALIYSAAAALLAAAVKLLRLGQNAVQALLTEALSLAPKLIAQALSTPLTEAGSFTPWWDVASARHERADFRLFIS